MAKKKTVWTPSKTRRPVNKTDDGWLCVIGPYVCEGKPRTWATSMADAEASASAVLRQNPKYRKMLVVRVERVIERVEPPVTVRKPNKRTAHGGM